MRNHFSLRGADRAGMEPAAAIEAARQRFRPIVMTSLAFILGCIPLALALALASGAGANSQHAIGIGIIGGMRPPPWWPPCSCRCFSCCWNRPASG